MQLNKQHPNFSEYDKLFSQIVDEWDKEKSRIRKAKPNFQGLDGPSAIIDKKYALKIKALQQEYSYLFYEEE